MAPNPRLTGPFPHANPPLSKLDVTPKFAQAQTTEGRRFLSSRPNIGNKALPRLVHTASSLRGKGEKPDTDGKIGICSDDNTMTNQDKGIQF
jgi:hypothetical protein